MWRKMRVTFKGWACCPPRRPHRLNPQKVPNGIRATPISTALATHASELSSVSMMVLSLLVIRSGLVRD
jgi:hypothetical protein